MDPLLIRRTTKIIFDSDGVILDSNQVKTLAFAKTLKGYAQDQIDFFLSYHRSNGGLSRYEKFNFFLKKYNLYTDSEYLRLIKKFSIETSLAYEEAQMTKGIKIFLAKLLEEQIDSFIITANEERQSNIVYKKKSLSRYFKTILGSPGSKEDNVKELFKSGFIGKKNQVIFFGDSIHDHQCAQKFGFQFIFVNGYTELDNWDLYVKNHKILTIRDFSELQFNIIP